MLIINERIGTLGSYVILKPGVPAISSYIVTTVGLIRYLAKDNSLVGFELIPGEEVDVSLTLMFLDLMPGLAEEVKRRWPEITEGYELASE